MKTHTTPGALASVVLCCPTPTLARAWRQALQQQGLPQKTPLPATTVAGDHVLSHKKDYSIVHFYRAAAETKPPSLAKLSLHKLTRANPDADLGGMTLLRSSHFGGFSVVDCCSDGPLVPVHGEHAKVGCKDSAARPKGA